MRALTVKQPWAHAILHLGKDVENRTWNTTHRGPLAIHAGMKFDEHGGRQLEGQGHDMLVNMPGGVIVGVVDVLDCVFSGRASGWGEANCYHWQLANPRPLVTPIPYRGQQGLFTLDGEAAVKVNTMIRVRQR